ncbi:30S ribosomal protein S14 [bacterium]|jgi:small subunit ribosomal protein S14|nr:30S ribosomal protein S14 [bacterium]
MAKTSVVERNKKRQRMIAKYAAQRASLKAIVKDNSKSFEEKMAAQAQLTKLPRNSSRVRYRNRCAQTGRPRAYSRFFGLSRMIFRELASFGLLPGVKKASW